MINEKAQEHILSAIVKEKEAAVSNYGYFHSDHEFWAVLHEEIEELKEYSNFLLTKETILWSFTRENRNYKGSCN